MDQATIMTLAGIILDIALGGIAFRLARSLEKSQVQTTALLTELTVRVERLEQKS